MFKIFLIISTTKNIYSVLYYKKYQKVFDIYIYILTYKIKKKIEL